MLCCVALTGLPLPDKHESLLAEMLFSQMLRLPAAPFKPLAYSALMASSLHNKRAVPCISPRRRKTLADVT